MGSSPPQRYDREEVERRMFAAYAVMAPEERLARASRLSVIAEKVALSRLRQGNPGASERELWMRLIALRIPREAMLAIFGWAPEE